MAKQLTDEEINLRRKLRHRLIGAAALMLAMVVVLPMVLDNEPKATGEDIDLRIPSADKVGEFVPNKAAVEEIVPASAVSDGQIASQVVETVALPIATPSVAVAHEQAVAKTVDVVKPEPAQAIPEKTEPVKADPVKVVPIKAEASKPTKVETPVTTVVEKSADASGFVAQVGAYSNADTAKHELAKLKEWGFKAYTEKVGDKIRVRVGPYADRSKAEQVRHLLEKHGLHPVVVNNK